ncbi:MAG: BrnT family toxin [Gammaproteobacteria bacterium]|nr:BrnT family toxin [Gammaproteobacteria bacterium]
MATIAGFDWDHANRTKCQKHGVPVATIEAMFAGEVAVLPDPVHSQREERFHAIGRLTSGRGVFVVFTLRQRDGETLIRPISARYMHREEVAYYEKKIAKTDKR